MGTKELFSGRLRFLNQNSGFVQVDKGCLGWVGMRGILDTGSEHSLTEPSVIMVWFLSPFLHVIDNNVFLKHSTSALPVCASCFTFSCVLSHLCISHHIPHSPGLPAWLTFLLSAGCGAESRTIALTLKVGASM